MKAQKYSFKETTTVNLGTKIIYKYPTPTPELDIGKMVVKGRHPQPENSFILEHVCQFIMYITKGSGKVFAGDDVFEVQEQDVVFVPNSTKFAVEGELEYITVDAPAYFKEQSEEVVG